MKVGILANLTVDPRECIKHCTDLGFKSGQISVWNMDLYNEKTAFELISACRELEFEISALWCGWSGPCDWSYPNMYATLGLVPPAWRERRTFDILKGSEFARALGVRDIITHIGYIPDDPRNPDNYGTMLAVKYIAEKIAPHGQRLLFETGEELPTTLLRMICDTGCDNLGINFDPSNLITSGRANPTDALERFMPYVYGFHAKDGVPATGFEAKGKQAVIGKGKVDFRTIFKMLNDANKDIDITIEFEMPGITDRDPYIKDAKIYLEKLIGEIESWKKN